MTVASRIWLKDNRLTFGRQGGYLFLCISTTRRITAIRSVQNRKNNSQVMYIGITSLYRGRQTKRDF